MALEKQQREAERRAAVVEILAGVFPLSDRACRVALRAVTAAARGVERDGGRTGRAEGVGCTLTAAPGVVGRVDGVTWSVLVPGRQIVFHREGVGGGAVSLPQLSGGTGAVAVCVEVAA
ncbi:hypothetical protein [Streptomyces sp. BE133]|uniref:hypothetical protein n=1 Tax=Streptomyces sp. BE133 TaxID=3002523 RepID=UPI002E78D6FF|nr:hypothetical protein [Streptomyces sp. BE133]MEE1806770.1 hypothetical protein [Streptomyces sp. BE133]